MMSVEIELNLSSNQTHRTTDVPVVVGYDGQGQPTFDGAIVQTVTCDFLAGNEAREILRIVPDKDASPPSLNALQATFRPTEGSESPFYLGRISLQSGGESYVLSCAPPLLHGEETTWMLRGPSVPPIKLQVVIKRKNG